MNSSTDNLERCQDRSSLLFIGSSGAGKSATINHLLHTDKVMAKTGRSEPETNSTSEIVVTVKDADGNASDLTMGIIDTPGLNDPRSLNQDNCNLSSIKQFFENHPLYSKTKCYPNLVFLLVNANDHRIEGTNSRVAKTLRALAELDVVDKQHPNVVAVLTFCCSITSRDDSTWNAKMDEKKNIISRHIEQILEIQAPVVLLENNYDDCDLGKAGQFTLLPNKEKQPKNLYEVCVNVLTENNDQHGLLAFEACFTKPNMKKKYETDRYKVTAIDATTKNGPRSGSNSRLLGNSRQDRSRFSVSVMIGVNIVVSLITLVIVIVKFCLSFLQAGKSSVYNLYHGTRTRQNKNAQLIAILI